ncbi:CBP3-like protein [Podospora australis]|uniref:CBP3-like protein n=1 Tax=Podospora australis TaxID=1536484 RepID=A0AAN7AI44_9PEZI|nr:CBP3-like protein [Podospora australis]
MACPSCRATLRLLPRRPAASPTLRQSSAIIISQIIPQSARSQQQSKRTLHTTPPLSAFRDLVRKYLGSLAKDQSPYHIYQATERLYKACSAQADYTIDPKSRKAGTLKTTDEGEEIGVSTGGPWHNDLHLLPTFSTWAQVTMLHMYLLVLRFRNMPQEKQSAWQEGLVNHFFYHAEAKMEFSHELSSRLIRQRYLKDLFVQWRGLMLACDEGVTKGDAVLAAAVWRNLFKADENVDTRNLAAVVSWMRFQMKALDQLPDELVERNGEMVFKTAPVNGEFRSVDVPAGVLRGAFEQEGLVAKVAAAAAA